jgi:hypothetical protein
MLLTADAQLTGTIGYSIGKESKLIDLLEVVVSLWIAMHTV